MKKLATGFLNNIKPNIKRSPLKWLIIGALALLFVLSITSYFIWEGYISASPRDDAASLVEKESSPKEIALLQGANRQDGLDVLAEDNPGRGTDDKLAVILVIDISGSMRRTDPDNLREEAARIFVDLARHEDYLGIVAFDSEAETIIPLQTAGNTANKTRLKEELTGKLEPRSSTDFAGAFSKTMEKFRSPIGSDVKEVVVFLTDGDPNPDPDRRDEPGFLEDYMETVWGQVDDFAGMDVPVFTIGFGEVDRPEILERISSETGAESYYLDGSKELSISIFDIMSSLTGNTPLYRGDIVKGLDKDSQEATKIGEFEFLVDKYTRQVNLLLVGEELVGGEDVRLITPGGEDISFSGDIHELTDVSVVSEEGYTLVIIDSEFGGSGDNVGRWKLGFNGGASFGDTMELFADEVKFVRTIVKSPAYESNYPVNEPINIRVKVEGLEDEDIHEEIEKELREDPDAIRVEASVFEPGTLSSNDVDFIILEEEDGYYEGTVEGRSKPGNRDLIVKVFFREELVSEAQSRFSVVLAPRVTTDINLQDVYSINHEMVVTAFLTMSGNRLVEREGRLEVDAFEFVTRGKDGGGTTAFYLNDEGRDGDLRKSDGIWTSRVSLNELKEQGEYSASLNIEGFYRGEEFSLNKQLGDFTLATSGYVEVNFGEGSFFGAPGRRAVVSASLVNNSMFETDVFFKSIADNTAGDETDGGTSKNWHTEERVTLSPGEEKSQVLLNLDVPSGLKRDSYIVPIQVTASKDTKVFLPGRDEVALAGGNTGLERDKDKGVEVGRAEIEVEVISYGAYLFRSLGLSASNNPVLLGAFVFGGGLLIIYVAGGVLCYNRNIKPLNRLHGVLKYLPESAYDKDEIKNIVQDSQEDSLVGIQDENALNIGPQGEINLGRASSDELVLTLGKEFSKLNSARYYMYRLDKFDSSYNLVIQLERGSDTSELDKKLFYRSLNRGWKSLKKELTPPRILIKVTPPGVIKTEEGENRSRIELYHGDSFITGGYVFLYLNEDRIDIDENMRGRDIFSKQTGEDRGI